MKKYDCIIIGGGIAGITAAIYLKQANKDVLLIEKSAPGGILNKISTIKNYPGLPGISGPDLAYNLYNQVKSMNVEILLDTVLNIKHLKNSNKVILKDQELSCKYLILATGKEPRKLNLEYEDELVGKGISYCALCDANFYKDKEVAVIGAGESALKEALYLANICSLVTIINKYDYFKCKEDIVKEIEKKNNIRVLYHSFIKSLEKDNNYLTGITYEQDQKIKELPVSGVFVYIGSTPNIFGNLKLELDKNYIKVDNNMQTNIETIYAVGDVIKKDLYQLVNAASEGMIAATNIIKNLNKK